MLRRIFFAGMGLSGGDFDSATWHITPSDNVADYGILTVIENGNRSRSLWVEAYEDAIIPLGAETIIDMSIVVIVILDDNPPRAPITFDFTLEGTNDLPVFDLGAMTEYTITDTDVISETNTQKSISGELAATDVDIGDILTWTSTRPTNLNDYGAFTINADTGAWTFTPNAGINRLGAGQTEVLTFTITVADQYGGTDTETLTITLTGINDAPVISTISNREVHEIRDTDGANTPSSIWYWLRASDVDTGDSLSWSFTQSDNAADYGAFGISSSSSGRHWWQFTPNADINSLGAGQTEDLIFTITVTDQHDATDTETLTIRLEGANDAPVISTISEREIRDTDGTNSANTPPIIRGWFTASDVDDGDSLSLSFTQPGNAADYGAFRIHSSNSGRRWWEFTPNAEINSLGAGQVERLTFTITATDQHGLTGDETFSILLVGTNDAPVIRPISDREIRDTDGADSENRPSSIWNWLRARDVDTGDSLSWSFTQSDNAADYGEFGIHSSNSGRWWEFTPNADINSLGAGQTEDLIFTITVTDQHGGTDTETLTITLTGINDAPVISTISNREVRDDDGADSENTPSYLAYWLRASDVDTGDSLSWSFTQSDNAADYGAFGIHSSNSGRHWWQFTPNAEINSLGAGQTEDLIFTITVTDQHGGTDTETLTITLTGINDAPVLSTISDREIRDTDGANTPSSIWHWLRASDVDTGDSLSWSFTQSDNAADYGGAFWFPVSHYGRRGWEFTPNAEINSLGAGQTEVLTFTITVADQHGLTDDDTFTITLTGINDLPVFNLGAMTEYTITDTDVISETNTQESISGELTATDVDIGDTLTWTSTRPTNLNDYGEFTIGPNTGVWRFAPDAGINDIDAGQTEVLTFTITVADQHGGTDTETVTINLVGADVAPTNLRPGADDDIETQRAGGLAVADTLASGSLLFDDIDGDTFGDSHIFVQGAAGSPSNFADGSNTSNNGKGHEIVGTYGSLFLKNDGTWSYELNLGDSDTQAIGNGEKGTETFQFRVQGRHGGTTVSSNIHEVNIDVRGSEVIELSGDAKEINRYDQPASGRIEATIGDSTIGDSTPRGTTTFTVALNENDAGVSGLDDGIGRIEISSNGRWTYSLTSLDGLNAAAEAAEFDDTLDSGETLTRSFYVRASNDTIQEANRVATMQVEVTIHGMDVVEAAPGQRILRGLNDSNDTVYIGSDDRNIIVANTGKHIIIAGGGNDNIALNHQGTSTIYHRFASRGGEFLNTDGGDTVRYFTRNDDKFILVDVDATPEDEVGFFEATGRVELHAQINSNAQMLTGFELRFMDDDSRVKFIYTREIDVSGSNGDDFFGVGRSDVVGSSGGLKVTNQDLWRHFFGDEEDGEENFQVVDELPPIINDLIGNSAPVIVSSSVAPRAITDTDATSNANTPDSINGLFMATDVDTGDTLTWSFTSPDNVADYGEFSETAGVWRFMPNAGINRLAAGQTEDLTFTISVADGNGGRDTAALTITLTGADDAPTNLRPGADDDIETQRAGGLAVADTLASGSLLFNDVDGDVFGDSHIFVQGAVGRSGNFADGNNISNNGKGHEIEGTYGSLFLKNDGTWSYELNLGDSDTRAIENGEKGTETFLFRVQGRSGGTTVSSNTHVVDIKIRGSEVIELTNQSPEKNSFYDQPASGRIEATIGDSTIGDSTPRGTTTFTVALNENDAGMSGLDDGIGRIEISSNGRWTYSLTSLDGLNAAAEAAEFDDTLDSGETLTRSFYVRASNDTIQEANRVATMQVEVTIHGMDVVEAAPGQRILRGLNDSNDTVYIGSDDRNIIVANTGKHIIIAGGGNDNIALNHQGTSTIYHRFASRGGEFLNTDGGDTVRYFTRNDDKFILVDVDATPEDEVGFFEATGRVELHAQINSNAQMLTGFELRFMDDDSRVKFIYTREIDVSGSNGDDFFGVGRSDVVGSSGGLKVTNQDLWRHFFGDEEDGEENFQVVDELPPIINDLIGNSAPVIVSSSVAPRAITDTDATSNANTPDSINGLFMATDVDTGDTLTWSFTSPDNVADYGEFSETAGAWRFMPNAGINRLDAGQTEELTFTISVDDGNGGRDTAALTITLLGADAAPTNLRPGADDDIETQRAGGLAVADTLASGSLLFDDIDGDTFGDSHIFVQGATGASNAFADGSNISNNGKGHEIEGTYGNLFLKNDGTWSYELDDTDPDTQGIGNGEEKTETFLFRVQGRSGGTTVSSNTHVVDIKIRGSEVIELTNQSPEKNRFYDQPASGRIEATIGDSTPRGTTTFTVALNENDAGMSGLDDGVGRIEINSNGRWTYSLTSLDGLNAAAEAAGFDDTLDSGETLTRSFYVRASNDTIQEANRVATMQVEVTIHGMDVARVTDSTIGGLGGINTVYIGGDDEDVAFVDPGRGIIIAGGGGDDIFLNSQGTSTIYHRFASRGGEFLNTDGGDTVSYFTRNDNKFILVDVDATPEDEVGFFEATGRVELHAQINSNAQMLTGFELRFMDDDSRVKFIYTREIDVSGSNGDDFFGVGRSDVVGSSGGLKVTDQDLWRHFFGDEEENFQVVDELPPIINDLIGNSAPVIVSSSVAPRAITDTDANTLTSINGLFMATDVDIDDNLTWSFTSPDNVADYGEFSETAGAWRFTLNEGIDRLAAGQTEELTFTIGVADGNGGRDTGTLTITLVGGNDAPVINTIINPPDITDSTSNVNTPTFISGEITATDVDSDDNLTWSFTSPDNVADYGEFRSSETAGVWRFTLNEGIDRLAAGQTEELTFTIGVADGNGGSDTGTLTITLVGGNDVPVIDSHSVAPRAITDTDGTSNVNTPTFISGMFTATDVDIGDNLTWSFTSPDNVADYGEFSETAGAWRFTLNEGFDRLAAGQTEELTFTIGVADGNGGSDTGTLTITLVGGNDAPVINTIINPPDITDGTSNVNTPTFISGEITATDVDSDDNLTWSFTSPDNVADYGEFRSSETAGVWRFTLNEGIDRLAAGQTEELTFTIDVADGNGGSDTGTLTITLVGADDAPTNLRSGAEDIETQRAGGLAVADTLASGSLLFDDIDGDTFGDSHIFVQGAAGASNVFIDGSDTLNDGKGREIEGTYGNFFLKNDGTWSYQLDDQHADTLGIESGDVGTETFLFRVQGRSGGTTVSSNTHVVDIKIRGSEVIELTNQSPEKNSFYDQPASGRIEATIGDSTPRGTTTFTVALNENDAGMSGLDDGVGRIEINSNGRWTYSLTSLDGLNAAAEAAGFDDTLDSGETLTRSFYVRASNDTIQEANRVATMQVEVTIHGMDVARVTDSTIGGLGGINTVYIGGDDEDVAFVDPGRGIIIAGGGGDDIFLNSQGTSTIYHRFASRGGEFLNTDGGDTVSYFTRNDNKFILVDVDATPEDEVGFFEATGRVELHAQINSNAQMLTGFELRFMDDDSRVKFIYTREIDVSGSNGDDFFGVGRSDVVGSSGGLKVTDQDLWRHFFGDEEENFQVVDELPPIVAELI